MGCLASKSKELKADEYVNLVRQVERNAEERELELTVARYKLHAKTQAVYSIGKDKAGQRSKIKASAEFAQFARAKRASERAQQQVLAVQNIQNHVDAQQTDALFHSLIPQFLQTQKKSVAEADRLQGDLDQIVDLQHENASAARDIEDAFQEMNSEFGGHEIDLLDELEADISALGPENEQLEELEELEELEVLNDPKNNEQTSTAPLLESASSGDSSQALLRYRAPRKRATAISLSSRIK